MDVYHLWIFPQDFQLPFGIHPTRDKQCKSINRGYPQNAAQLAEQTQKALEANGKWSEF